MSELESIHPKGAQPLVRVFARYMRFLLQSNLYVAGGAGCLAYSAAVLQGLKPRIADFFITFFYVFAMHVLNRYADKAARFNDPSRAAFYKRYRIPFFLASLGAVVIALLIAISQGSAVFLGLLAMIGLGLLYSVRIFPESWLRYVRIVKLKDIPASKTLFIAGGWSAVATLLPAMGEGQSVGGPTIFTLVVVFGLVLFRSAIFDILDIQSDRLVGEETIPIVLGESRTKLFLIYAVLTLALLLVIAPALRLATDFSYVMILCCVYSGFYLFVNHRELIRPGSRRFEALVETHFYLAGVLAVLYQLIAHSK